MTNFVSIDLANFRKNIFQYHGVRPCPCYGEDGVFEKIFEVIGLPKVPQIFEFGEHRVLGTTSRFLRISHKCRALYFSQDYNFYSAYLNIRDLFKIAKKYRIIRFNYFLNMPKRLKANKHNIAKIILNFFDKKEIDLGVIDIDSNDYEIIDKILKENIFPRVLVVEYNPSLGNDCLYMSESSIAKKTHPRQYGASYSAILQLIQPFDYSLVHISGFCNLIFIKNEYATYFKTPELTKFLTLTDEAVEDYCDKWCLPQFIPSWHKTTKLSKLQKDIFHKL